MRSSSPAFSIELDEHVGPDMDVHAAWLERFIVAESVRVRRDATFGVSS
jgi:hypothetical protein